ncbi:MAG: hypothetical protein QM727_06075 [Niabella sp.]
MSKKILAVYYTQSGQLRQILDNFLRPMTDAGHSVEFLQIKPVESERFPFPWTTEIFFEAMPDCVNVVPSPIEPWQVQQEKYDLIVLGWQPWFLSPSIPVNSILQDEKFKQLIRDTPVVTISGCRNMWINAQEKNKKLLQDAAAKLVGNIALVDRTSNHVSLVTIFYWMITGRKDRKWGIFPRPGVSDNDIENAAVFGETVQKHLASGDWETLQPELVRQKGVMVKYSLMFIERKAGKIFKIWSKIITKRPGKRKQLLVAFKYYLLIALVVASPIILLVDLIFFRPFLQKRIKRQMRYYSGVSLN